MSTFPPAPPGGLLRNLALHLAIGVGAGVALAAILFATNVGGLGELVGQSAGPALAVMMLCIMNALTFGSLAMGYGIMSLPRERDM